MQLVNAKAKALAVIDSCETIQQVNGAKNFVELYNNRFDDFVGYEDLNRRLKNKKEEIKSYGEKN